LVVDQWQFLNDRFPGLTSRYLAIGGWRVVAVTCLSSPVIAKFYFRIFGLILAGKLFE